MVKPLAALLAASALAGCALSHAAKAGEGIVEQDVVEVFIKADPQLNKFQDNSHSLLLCLYQLKDPSRFRQLARDARNVAKLLECGRFDDSVLHAGQVIVQPGQELRQIQDLGEGTRYLGVAGGYYSMGKRRVAELFPIPVKGPRPSPRMVLIELGPHEIRSVRAK